MKNEINEALLALSVWFQIRDKKHKRLSLLIYQSLIFIAPKKRFEEIKRKTPKMVE